MIDLSLSELMSGLRSGQITASELFEEAALQYARLEGSLNAYRIWDRARGQSLARKADEAFRAGRDLGPLQGIPVSVKDLYGLDGFNIYAGTRQTLPVKWRREGPLIKLLREQLAVVAGKTHMVEFAFGAMGLNSHWPVPRNPWDAKDHRVPGGSSSGAGVSLVEGTAIIALGSDTAGSVRIPASVTGTFGYKPSPGRWPLDGLVPLSPTFDTPGFLARNVADASIVFDAIDGALGVDREASQTEAPGIAGLRIGVADEYFWDNCEAGIGEAVQSAIGELGGAGAKVVTCEMPETTEAYSLFRAGGLAASELKQFLQTELPEWLDLLDPVVRLRLANCPDVDSAEFANRKARLKALAAQAQSRFDGVDVLVCPTVPVTPRKLADVADLEAYARANMAILRNTCIANLLGFCAVTLPVGLDAAGMPVGLQCMARRGTDRWLMAIALAIEGVIGSASTRLGHPPLLDIQN